jgi:hypothetical protein
MYVVVHSRYFYFTVIKLPLLHQNGSRGTESISFTRVIEEITGIYQEFHFPLTYCLGVKETE